MKKEDKKQELQNPVVEGNNQLTAEQQAIIEKGIKLTDDIAKLAADGTVTAQAVSTDLVSELNNIDFAKMIGGPLQAAIQAQAASAITTVNFIKDLGFKPVDPNAPNGAKELVMVDFSYEKNDVNPDTGEVIPTKRFIKVPFIAMLPIPSIRIETVDIDFNVKLNSVESQTIKDKFAVGTEVKAGWGPVSFKVSASYQRSSTYGVEVKKEYTLNVKVKASQDEMPAGLEKLLGILAA
ncbi:MAG: DUF2589 domain-containing protein [Anaerolineae bacterium]|nr:DUF2589 domain-containing protein [Anaerolineae bacterium]